MFIMIEGTDGSGKSLQTGMLVKHLRETGRRVEEISFPQYGQPSAAMVEAYLNGQFGTSQEVGPKAASILYAVDRFAARKKIETWLSEGAIVVTNRYVASNMGHQGGKIKDPVEREQLFTWLYELEYTIFGIPKPDVNIILHVTPEISQQLVDKKGKREYLKGKKRDIHEDDLNHLRDAEQAYLHIATLFPEFKVIECVEQGNLLSPEAIHEKVWREVAAPLTIK